MWLNTIQKKKKDLITERMFVPEMYSSCMSLFYLQRLID